MPSTPVEDGLKVLLDYTESLLSSPDTASLDVEALPEAFRPLGERLRYLGECLQEARKLAAGVSSGDLTDLEGANLHPDNPLLPSLKTFRDSIAHIMATSSEALADAADARAAKGPKTYLRQLEGLLDQARHQQISLERIAFTDPLTGVGNRKSYEHQVDRLWDEKTPFTLAFVDIDNLKLCNDAFGHDAGNEYIDQAANTLMSLRGPEESVFRLGGDEFVFLSPTASEGELDKRLESGRARLMETSKRLAPMTFTFSYGCSRVDPSADEDRQQLLADADRKMYRYKLTSRASIEPPRHRPASAPSGTSGTDERVFEALAMTSEGRYLFIYDIERDEALWSSNAVRDLGLPAGHLHNTVDTWANRIHPEDRAAYLENIRKINDGVRHRSSIQYRMRDAAGDYVLCESRGFRLDAAGDKPALFVGAVVNRSVAENIDPATGLGDVNGLIAAIASCRYSHVPLGLVAARVEGIMAVNTAHGHVMGDHLMASIAMRVVSCSRGKAIVYRARGTQLVLVMEGASAEQAERLALVVREALKEPVEVDGLTFELPAHVVNLHFDSVVSQSMSILGELERRVRAETEKYDTLAGGVLADVNGLAGRTDSLTGLRRGNDFLIDAGAFVARASRKTGCSSWCLATLDLGNLRLYNEWYGKRAGDVLLIETARVLAGAEKRGEAFVGYWGQDDFSLILPFNQSAITGIYRRVRNVIAAHDSSAGFLPTMGVLPLEKAQAVDIDAYSKALYANRTAKLDFKNRVALFDPGKYEQSTREHVLLSSFQFGLANGDITFFLQPQVDIEDGSVVGAEALARWQRSDGTSVSPAEFVPVLERNGFVTMLDKFIWKSVARWLRHAIAAGLDPVPVSINISRVDIVSFDVTAFIEETVAEAGIPAHLIKAEITETAYTEESDAVEKTISGLKDLGISLFMDDFGSGQSSLSMLSEVNVDVIKLDRRFLPKNDGNDEKSASIVRSMVSMAHSLGLPMIVEGVETDEQVDFLKRLGCRYVQGFRYYRPMPPDEFEHILADTSARRGGFAKFDPLTRG